MKNETSEKILKKQINLLFISILIKDFENVWPNFLDELCFWDKNNIFANENNLELLKIIGLKF